MTSKRGFSLGRSELSMWFLDNTANHLCRPPEPPPGVRRRGAGGCQVVTMFPLLQERKLESRTPVRISAASVLSSRPGSECPAHRPRHRSGVCTAGRAAPPTGHHHVLTPVPLISTLSWLRRTGACLAATEATPAPHGRCEVSFCFMGSVVRRRPAVRSPQIPQPSGQEVAQGAFTQPAALSLWQEARCPG